MSSIMIYNICKQPINYVKIKLFKRLTHTKSRNFVLQWPCWVLCCRHSIKLYHTHLVTRNYMVFFAVKLLYETCLPFTHSPTHSVKGVNVKRSFAMNLFSFTYSQTHSLTHKLIHLLTNLFIHSVIYILFHSFTHSVGV